MQHQKNDLIICKTVLIKWNAALEKWFDKLQNSLNILRQTLLPLCCNWITLLHVFQNDINWGEFSYWITSLYTIFEFSSYTNLLKNTSIYYHFSPTMMKLIFLVGLSLVLDLASSKPCKYYQYLIKDTTTK